MFADLGFDDPEELLLKAELVRRISAEITGRHLTQVQAAQILGIDQPKVATLLRFLRDLGNDVDSIVTKAPAEERGRLRMTA